MLLWCLLCVARWLLGVAMVLLCGCYGVGVCYGVASCGCYGVAMVLLCVLLGGC